jgi:hypothetical protein
MAPFTRSEACGYNFYLFAARELIFVKMWPSNEFEFETPDLDTPK